MSSEGQSIYVLPGGRELALGNDLTPDQVQVRLQEELAKLASQPLTPRATLGEAPAAKQESINWWQVAKQAALPTVAALGMGTAGTILGGPPGGAVGAGIGGMAGLKANEMLGIEKPGALSYLAAAAGPWAGPVARPAMMRLPGAAAGIQEKAVQQLPQIAESVRPPVPSSQLYEAMTQQFGRLYMPVGPIRQAAQEMAKENARILPEFRDATATRIIDGLQRMSQAPIGGIEFETMRANGRQLGRLVGALDETSSVAEGVAKRAFRAVREAMEAGATQSGGRSAEAVKALKEANQAVKQEIAEGMLETASRQATTWVRGQPQVNADGLLRFMTRHREEFVDLVGQKGLDFAQKKAIEYAKLPKISGGGIGPIKLRNVIGGGLGSAVGGPAGGVGGVIAAEGTAKLMESALGRAMVRGIISHAPVADQTFNVLGHLGRSVLSEAND